MDLTIEFDVANALREDIGSGDITAGLIPEQLEGKAQIHAREPAVVCGQAWVKEVLKQVSPALNIDWHVQEASVQVKPCIWATISGPLGAMLTAERTALNFLQTLSAVATKTHKYVELLKGSQTNLLDTRKTIPGLRLAEKYAVRCGGGFNHRMGLYDEFLIKENHIEVLGSLEAAVKLAKKQHSNKPIVVEVQNLEEFKIAQSLGVTRIMLDNFNDAQIAEAIYLNRAIRCPIEVSGGINETRIHELVKMGVDFISVGDLTKSVQAIDLSLLVQSNS